jgi:hypothetical protein
MLLMEVWKYCGLHGEDRDNVEQRELFNLSDMGFVDIIWHPNTQTWTALPALIIGGCAEGCARKKGK